MRRLRVRYTIGRPGSTPGYGIQSLFNIMNIVTKQNRKDYEMLKRFRAIYGNNNGLDTKTGLIYMGMPRHMSRQNIGGGSTPIYITLAGSRTNYGPFFFEGLPVLVRPNYTHFN